MSLQAIGDWLASTPLSLAIQMSTWLIPTIQIVHILALALVFTAGLLLALRLTGYGLLAEPLPQFAARNARRIWVMLGVLLLSGGLLITAEPGRTLTNPAFFAKMISLLVVIALTLWLSFQARQGGAPTRIQAAVAWLGVALWVAIVILGRFIAYV